jgi:hypothetical protein
MLFLNRLHHHHTNFSSLNKKFSHTQEYIQGFGEREVFHWKLSLYKEMRTRCGIGVWQTN